LKHIFLLIFTLLSQLLTPPFASLNHLALKISQETISFGVSPQPIYVRLQAMQEGSVVFWQSIPQSFQDHVATINVSVLGVLVSSNARSVDLYKDEIGNLWLAVNYTFKKGDYISTLTWVSSETVEPQNLTIPELVPFPESYPNNITRFLNPGRKLPVNNTMIKEIAESYAGQDMIQTIKNILNFINATQTYDREKVRLLMTGMLNTTDILDFLNDPLKSLESNSSFCFERALLAVTMLRAVRVPARIFTNADLKTWTQVWLPNIGWVDAEVLCTQKSQPIFPRPLSFTVPLMTENSSDAMFPFTWHPEVLMRVANLTLSHLEAFKINDYGTVLSQPIDVEIYEANPDGFSFPIIFEPEIVQAALTLNGSDITFHLSKGERKISKTLVLGQINKIEFEGLGVSFTPIHQGDMIVLNNFSVNELWIFDVRILIPIVAAVPILIFWFYWKRKRVKP